MAKSHKPTVNEDSSVTKEKQKSDEMKINVCLCRLLQQSGSLKLRSKLKIFNQWKEME